MSARGAVDFADSEARRRAATEFAHNLVVVAGAGTGKTSLLVERILVAVGSGIAELHEIAALTFTEKAAGEIRERLASGLEELRRAALTGEDGDADRQRASTRARDHLVGLAGASCDEIAVRCLAALERLDQAPIVTIHTFCTQLLHAWPMLARVDPGFVVDEGQEFDRLFDEAWESFLRAELGPAARNADLWRRVLRSVGMASMQTIARALARFNVPPEAIRIDASPDGPLLVAHMAAETAGCVRDFLVRATGIKPWKLQFLEELRDALTAVGEGIPALRHFVQERPEMAHRIAVRNLPEPDRTLSGATAEEFEQLVRDANDLVRDLLTVDEDRFREAATAVRAFSLGFRETYLARGFVSFDGILVLARDLLRDHAAAREGSKQRLRMILVDEFQDTDPLQYEIVLFLGERRGGRAQDAYDADLEPGRLFIVGDPKQSIYRFRGADYSAFAYAARRVIGTGGVELTLRTNFRSVPGVVQPINALFEPNARTAWRESDYQPRYVPIAAARAEIAKPAVEVWTVCAADGSAPATALDRRRIEGRILAREIARLVHDNEASSYAEITVLLRSFSSLVHYLRAFRGAGVPFVVAGGREFLARPEVSHLLSVLRAIAHPSDSVALLAYLRSPVGGVPDIEMAAFTDAGGPLSDRATPDPSTFPTLAPALERLRELQAQTRDLPTAALVGHVLRRTGLAIVSAVAFEGAQRVSNLRKLAAAAAEVASDGSLSLHEVLDAIEEQRVGSLEADSPLDDEGSKAVRISTVHAAKGLENRFVFVADLARGGNRGGAPSEVQVAWTPERTPIATFAAGGARSAARVWLERENAQHDEAEETRVFYVALTRARDRLVVLGASPRGNRTPGDWVLALAPWGYDATTPPADEGVLAAGRVRHRSMRDETVAKREELERPTAVDGLEAAYADALAALRARTRAPIARPSGGEERRRREEPEPEAASVRLDRSVARAAGTVVHRFLEAWNGVEEEDVALRRLAALARSAAAELGCSSADVESEASDAIDAFLRSPLAGRFRAIQPLAKEVPALLAGDDSAWRGTIDLIYRDGEGAIIVADFKTDRERHDDAVAAYRAQLHVYREAVRRALRLPQAPACELWWLRQGRIERL